MKSLWFTTTSIVFWVIFIIQLFLSMNFRDPPACFIFSICYINATLTKYLKCFLLWSVWLHTCICHYIFRNEVEENEALQVSSKRFSIFLSWSMLAEANWIVVKMIIIQKKACSSVPAFITIIVFRPLACLSPMLETATWGKRLFLKTCCITMEFWLDQLQKDQQIILRVLQVERQILQVLRVDRRMDRQVLQQMSTASGQTSTTSGQTSTTSG